VLISLVNLALYFRRKFFTGEALKPVCEIEDIKPQD